MVGATPGGRIAFNLPGLLPECVVELRGRRRVSLTLRLDTVIVDMDDQRLTLIWRGHVPVRNRPHDVLAIDVRAEQA